MVRGKRVTSGKLAAVTERLSGWVNGSVVTTVGAGDSKRAADIEEDLAGVLAGGVTTAPGELAHYASDASLHDVLPLAVTFPRHTEDVSAIVRYAADHQLPIIPRGAGTGLAGGALGQGIVVDFSRHMRQILEIGARTVVVQPGVVLDDLNRQLRKTGRHFAPDPSNAAITTIGGMIGVDAAGSRAVRVGSTRDHLEKLELVFADGTAHWLGREPVVAGRAASATPSAQDTDHDQYARIRVILRRLAAILNEHADLIRQLQPRLLRNAAGYMLRDLLQRGTLNVPRLIAGSEGTLALCTAAVLRTSPLPVARSVLLVMCTRFDQATTSLSDILECEPSACDLLDRRLLTLARESSSAYARLIPPYAEAALLVEFSEQDHNLLRRRRERLRKLLHERIGPHAIVAETETEDEAQRLWELPRQVVPLLARIQGPTRPMPLIEDIVIPPAAMAEFLPQAQKVLQRFQVTASLYAHAGSGQLHLRPFLELPTPATKSSFESLARDLYRVVQQYGGSISGEHGDGYSRTAFLRTQYGPLYRLFQQVKHLFDPNHLLNPEKIVSGDPHLTIRHLRQDGELVALSTGSESQLRWQPPGLSQAAAACNGCGQCKSHQPKLRMCPLHRAEPAEATSPRAQANTIRQFLIAQFTAEEQAAPALSELTVEQTLQACFNCKQCQHECPSQVDIPHLWLEAKSAHVAENGLPREDWYLSRFEGIAQFTWRYARIVNLFLRTTPGRWLLERITGIDRRRRLPLLDRRPYLQTRVQQPSVTATPGASGELKPLILFLDYYANYHDPDIVEAFTAILRHNNIPYLIPPEQEGAGMMLINVGDLAAAREKAETNLRILGPYAREGHPIVCIEPSSVVCLKQEYPLLIDHPDLAAVQRHVCEAGAYLQRLHDQQWLDTEFAPLQLSVGYHEPCHQRALGRRNPYHELLPLIPDLEFRPIDAGCSGMAGTFGLSSKNYDTSLEIGRELLTLVSDSEWQFASSECAACRLQLAHPRARPVIHPLKLIAAAYGLRPLPNFSEGSETQR